MKAFDSTRKVFGESIEGLKSFDWNDLGDIDTIGVWPGVVKSVICVAIFSICIGAGYWFWLKPLQEELDVVAAQEADLLGQLETKAVLAANLEAYRTQMQEMEETFGELLRQLPGETEVPGLLEDINFTGLGSGVVFSYIEPEAEVEEEFFVELPINIGVTGGYHDFGTFVSGVASLSRIVTLHDFEITSTGATSTLDMTITAKTYRYKSEDE